MVLILIILLILIVDEQALLTVKADRHSYSHPPGIGRPFQSLFHRGPLHPVLDP